jgi:hypothetical protein
MPNYEYSKYKITIEAQSKEEADKALQTEIENGNVIAILDDSTIEAQSKEEAPIAPDITGSDDQIPPQDETPPLDESNTAKEEGLLADGELKTAKKNK